jgi:copper transport protein
LLALVLLVPAAHASEGHPEFASASPAPAQQLAEAPASVRVEFTEQIQPEASRLVVLLGNATVSLPSRASDRTLEAGLKDGLGPGVYSVRWTVVTPSDGHATEGGYEFAVGNYTADGLFVDGDGTRWPEVLPRALQYAGLALMAGALSSFLLRWLGPRPASRLTLLGASAVAGGVAILWTRLQETSGVGNAAFAATDAGAFLFLRGLLGAAGVVLAAIWASRERRVPGSQAHALVLAAFLPVIAWTSGSTSHASAAGIVGSASDAIHLLAGATWMGALGILAWRLLRTPDDAEARQAGQAFGRLAIASVVALTVAGLATLSVIVGLSRLGNAAFWQSPYGLLLLAKVLLLLAMLFVAAIHRRGFLSQAPPAHPLPAPWSTAQAFRRLVVVEVVLGLMVLGLAGVLASTPPTAGSEPESLVVRAQGTQAGFKAEFAPPPLAPGTSELSLEVWELLEIQGKVERVALTSESVGRNGHIEVTITDPSGREFVQLAQPSGSRWHVPGLLFGLPGEYELSIHAETAYIIDGAARAPFDVEAAH